MITWIRSKIFYAHLKREIFKAFNHGDDWIKFLTNLAIAYKDASAEDIKKEFIGKLAEKVHEDGNKTREKKANE